MGIVMGQATWWGLATSVVVYLILAVGVLAVLFTFFRNSAVAEAIRFLYCAGAHKPWHVVQKEADTLTRMYCTKCGNVHLKMKRREDFGKPARLPDDLRSRTKRPH